MKISGFTIAKNAVTFDYPVVEAITSILPVCDEFVVNVGDCDDGTLELIQAINSPKIKSYKAFGMIVCVKVETFSQRNQPCV